MKSSALIFLLCSGTSLVSGSAPVCLPSDSSCSESDTTTDKEQQQPQCGLWLAESRLSPGRLNIFAGTYREPFERVAEPDLLVPLIDTNKNEWSPWHEFIWNTDLVNGLALENSFLSDIFVAGVGALVRCNNDMANIVAEREELKDSAGVHRSQDATAGSFTYYHNFAYSATHEMVPGEEIFIACDGEEDAPDGRVRRRMRSVDTLEEEGVCLDNLEVGPSTLPKVGRGAFGKRTVKQGEVIATTPVVHFDRSQMEIVRQAKGDRKLLRTSRSHGIQYTDEVIGQQLLLNYCFGDPESNILLLPYAPGVTAINHNREKANAAVRWGPDLFDDFGYKEHSRHDVLDEPGEHRLLLEFVALRDIEASEEIFIDYGDDWVEAWEKHVADYDQSQDESYISAVDYKILHENEPIRTQAEQTTEPYPENIDTVCYYKDAHSAAKVLEHVEWAVENFQCMRPCVIQKRHEPVQDGEGPVYYDAVVYNMKSVVQPEYCGKLPKDGLLVQKIPSYAVDIVDKRYTSDVHMKAAFRHEIGVPKDLYPRDWMIADPNPMGDFIPTKLEPGQLDPICWADTEEIVTPNGYRMGLDPHTRATLLRYCDKMGITEFFHHITVAGNAMEIGKDSYVPLNGNTWFLQRPDTEWRSNLQWFSPGDEGSQQEYLQALSEAGFDKYLNSIGETLGLDGLAVYHITFIGTSHSIAGYMHYDVTQTGAKTFNVIIPLILANSTGPELDVQDSERRDENGDYAVGRYKYEENVAVLNGDDAYHATSAVDYRTNKEFRMAATVYISEVTEDNVDNIMGDYTQHYPPPDRDLLLSWAGLHWKKDDPSRKLPTPSSDHILLRDSATETA